MSSTKEISRNFKDFDFSKVLVAPMTNACLIVERDAKRNAPVITGNLRNSITHSVSSTGAEGKVGSNVEYAPYVELGAGGRRPKPYLKPALDNNVSRIMRCFERII